VARTSIQDHRRPAGVADVLAGDTTDRRAAQRGAGRHAARCHRDVAAEREVRLVAPKAVPMRWCMRYLTHRHGIGGAAGRREQGTPGSCRRARRRAGASRDPVVVDVVANDEDPTGGVLSSRASTSTRQRVGGRDPRPSPAAHHRNYPARRFGGFTYEVSNGDGSPPGRRGRPLRSGSSPRRRSPHPSTCRSGPGT